MPFAQRFGQLDATERALFGAALVAATLSVVAFVTPITLHRFGPRTARSTRLRLSISCTRLGLLLLGLAMVLSLVVVAGFLYATAAAIVVVAAAIAGLWVVAPIARRGDPRSNTPGE